MPIESGARKRKSSVVRVGKWEREEIKADAEIKAGKLDGPYRGAEAAIAALKSKKTSR